MFAEGVNAAHAHAVQTARHLVAALVELAAGVQHSHNHLEGGAVLLFVHIYGYATAVIFYGDAVVFVNADIYLVAKASESLVD